MTPAAHPLDVLGHPVRRRLLELLATGEHGAGELVAAIGAEFGIGQPAVSAQLRILKDGGFATVRSVGTRRIYATDPRGLDAAEDAIARYRGAWRQRLDALHTEVARGKRERRLADSPGPRRTDPGATATRKDAS